jgi:hypothetical protein
MCRESEKTYWKEESTHVDNLRLVDVNGKEVFLPVNEFLLISDLSIHTIIARNIDSTWNFYGIQL